MARTTFTGPLVIGRAATTTSEGVNGEVIIQNADGSTSPVGGGGGVAWEVITASKSADAATGLFIDNSAQTADIIITMPATPGVGDTIQLKNITSNTSGFTFNEFAFFGGTGGIEGVVSGASGVGGATFSKGTPIPRGFGTTSGQYVYSGSTYGWVRV
jgi:hypothetical protein